MVNCLSLLKCGPVGHLYWHPQGRFFAAAVSRGGCVLGDADTGSWDTLDYRMFGPWSPEGTRVLARNRQGCWVLSWPDRQVLFELPLLPWFWSSEHILMAVKEDGFWRHEALHLQNIHHDPDGIWKMATAIQPGKVAGLRWRPSLNQLELASWHENSPFPTALRLPELEELYLSRWAWSATKEGWVAAGGPEGRHLWAWSYPQGWSIFERKTSQRILSVEHWKDGVAWVEKDGLRCHSFLEESTDLLPLDPSLHRCGGLAWNPMRQQFAVATAEGVLIAQPSP